MPLTNFCLVTFGPNEFAHIHQNQNSKVLNQNLKNDSKANRLIDSSELGFLHVKTWPKREAFSQTWKTPIKNMTLLKPKMLETWSENSIQTKKWRIFTYPLKGTYVVLQTFNIWYVYQYQACRTFELTIVSKIWSTMLKNCNVIFQIVLWKKNEVFYLSFSTFKDEGGRMWPDWYRTTVSSRLLCGVLRKGYSLCNRLEIGKGVANIQNSEFHSHARKIHESTTTTQIPGLWKWP